MIQELVDKKPQIAELCQRYGVYKLEVFGSAARATDFDQSHRSDVDVVAHFHRDRMTLSNYMGFKWGLEELFDRDVDVLMEGANKNPYFLAQLNAERQEVCHA